jgi:hypothetical protein
VVSALAGGRRPPTPQPRHAPPAAAAEPKPLRWWQAALKPKSKRKPEPEPEQHPPVAAAKPKPLRWWQAALKPTRKPKPEPEPVPATIDPFEQRRLPAPQPKQAPPAAAAEPKPLRWWQAALKPKRKRKAEPMPEPEPKPAPIDAVEEVRGVFYTCVAVTGVCFAATVVHLIQADNVGRWGTFPFALSVVHMSGILLYVYVTAFKK